jgi:small subunit ribosomal protein S6
MKQYETGFLISPNLTEEETDSLILQMAEVVSRKKGKMLKEDRWGKRRLAYPIDRFEEAFYVFFHYEGEHDVSSELERRFKQTDTVLRYLTVKKN